jgi:uncharacterized metal-binding protein
MSQTVGKKAGSSAGSKKNKPSCSECGGRGCYRAEPSAPDFCLTTENQEAARATRELYAGDNIDGRLARLAAEVEGEYYGRLTRLEETIVFAQKLKAKKLGIAGCIGLLDEAGLYAKIVRTAGIETRTVVCKVGAIDKTEIGLTEDLKVRPGGHESCCNPVLQARVLNEWGADLNILIGLCVGHDALFTRHSQAPAVTLIVKDRVLGHNPAAALYTSKFYYKRLLDRKTFPEPKK